MGERTYWLNKVMPLIMEYCIYLLAVFLFTDKGESFRSVGLYLPPVLIVFRMLIVKQWTFDYKNEIFILLIAFCLSAIVSSLFAENIAESFGFFKSSYLKVFLLFIVISSVFSDHGKLTRLILLLAVLSVFFSIITFYDFATKAFVTGGGIDYAGSVRRYSVPLEYLLPFVPCAFIISEKKVGKMLWALVLLLGIIALLLTGARGAWVGLLFSLTIWLVYYYHNRGRLKDIIVFIGGLVLLMILAMQIIPGSYIQKQVKKKFYSRSRFGMTWRSAIDNYMESGIDKKIIGKGLDKKIMYDDFDRWLEKNKDSVRFKKIAKNPHNFYLFILYKQGLIGLSVYISLVLVVILKLHSQIRRRTTLAARSVGIALIASLIGSYMVHGMVEDLQFLPLGFLLGLTGAYLNMAQITNENANDSLSCS